MNALIYDNYTNNGDAQFLQVIKVDADKFIIARAEASHGYSDSQFPKMVTKAEAQEALELVVMSDEDISGGRGGNSHNLNVTGTDTDILELKEVAKALMSGPSRGMDM